MALKEPYDSTLQINDTIIAALLEGGELRLYSNNHTPANGDALDGSDYTECTFPGYAAITLTGWPASSLDASNRASSQLAFQTFTAGTIVSPEDVYGIYVMSVGGDLVYAELNPGGVVSIAVTGQVFQYRPVYTHKSTF